MRPFSPPHRVVRAPIALVLAASDVVAWAVGWAGVAVVPTRPRHGTWRPTPELAAVLHGQQVPSLRPERAARRLQEAGLWPRWEAVVATARSVGWRPVATGAWAGAFAAVVVATAMSAGIIVARGPVRPRTVVVGRQRLAAADAQGDPGPSILASKAGSSGSALPGTAMGAPPAATARATLEPSPPAARSARPRSPATRGAIPVGKGMWVYRPQDTEGGDVVAIVARARQVGLGELYIRTGSSKDGFYAGPFLDALLGPAHRAGLRVYAWDFPYLDDVNADIARAQAAITHLSPSGDRVDGFVADVELPSMGVRVSRANAQAYGAGLRAVVGAAYPLIACVPRPTPAIEAVYSYADVTANFDAIMPMVYWLNRDPVADMRRAAAALAPLGKPLIPVGQAYDGAIDGGPAGVPSPAAIQAFMVEAARAGAVGVSFWSWQHADQATWDAIAGAPQFKTPTNRFGGLNPTAVRSYQALLTSLGFPAPPTGQLDATTVAALRSFQRSGHISVSGTIDDNTRALLLQPVAAPLTPRRAVAGPTAAPLPAG